MLTEKRKRMFEEMMTEYDLWLKMFIAKGNDPVEWQQNYNKYNAIEECKKYHEESYDRFKDALIIDDPHAPHRNDPEKSRQAILEFHASLIERAHIFTAKSECDPIPWKVGFDPECPGGDSSCLILAQGGLVKQIIIDPIEYKKSPIDTIRKAINEIGENEMRFGFLRRRITLTICNDGWLRGPGKTVYCHSTLAGEKWYFPYGPGRLTSYENIKNDKRAYMEKDVTIIDAPKKLKLIHGLNGELRNLDGLEYKKYVEHFRFEGKPFYCLSSTYPVCHGKLISEEDVIIENEKLILRPNHYGKLFDDKGISWEKGTTWFYRRTFNPSAITRYATKVSADDVIIDAEKPKVIIRAATPFEVESMPRYRSIEKGCMYIDEDGLVYARLVYCWNDPYRRFNSTWSNDYTDICNSNVIVVESFKKEEKITLYRQKDHTLLDKHGNLWDYSFNHHKMHNTTNICDECLIKNIEVEPAKEKFKMTKLLSGAYKGEDNKYYHEHNGGYRSPLESNYRPKSEVELIVEKPKEKIKLKFNCDINYVSTPTRLVSCPESLVEIVKEFTPKNKLKLFQQKDGSFKCYNGDVWMLEVDIHRATMDWYGREYLGHIVERRPKEDIEFIEYKEPKKKILIKKLNNNERRLFEKWKDYFCMPSNGTEMYIGETGTLYYFNTDCWLYLDYERRLNKVGVDKLEIEIVDHFGTIPEKKTKLVKISKNFMDELKCELPSSADTLFTDNKGNIYSDKRRSSRGDKYFGIGDSSPDLAEKDVEIVDKI